MQRNAVAAKTVILCHVNQFDIIKHEVVKNAFTCIHQTCCYPIMLLSIMLFFADSFHSLNKQLKNEVIKIHRAKWATSVKMFTKIIGQFAMCRGNLLFESSPVGAPQFY